MHFDQHKEVVILSLSVTRQIKWVLTKVLQEDLVT